MQQVIINGSGTYSPSTTVDSYNGIGTPFLWSTVETDTQACIPSAGTFSKLRIRLTVAPGAANRSYTFTLRVNGVDTALTVTISGSSTSGSDTTHTVDVTAGALVSLECDPSAQAPAATVPSWTLIFEGTSPIIISTGHVDNLYWSSGSWSSVSACYPLQSLYEYMVYEVIPTNGKLKNFSVILSSALPAGITTTIVVRVNGVDTDLIVYIYGGETVGSNTTTELSVVAGQQVSIHGGFSTFVHYTRDMALGMTFVPDNAGESIIMGASPDPSVSGVQYNMLNYAGWQIADWTDSEYIQLAQSCKLKHFWVILSQAPGSGKSYTFALRKNNITTELATTVADSAVGSANLTNVVSVAPDDLISLICTPSGTPSGVYTYWGIVCIPIPPPLSGAGIAQII